MAGGHKISRRAYGCVTDGVAAGELIDKAGLKGVQKGGGQVSTRHGNFIVNKGHAKACDVIERMVDVKETVFKRFGVELEPEVVIVGQEAGS